MLKLRSGRCKGGTMDISALNDSGKPVEWWFLYKVPHLTKSAQETAATGHEYVYYDPVAADVQRSPQTLLSGKSALDRTIASVMKARSATTGYLFYNDEFPKSVHKKDNGELGHTKGMIAFDTDSKTGFWLLHSWPKYVDPANKDDPALNFGQTYLCLTISLDTANQIAQQMAQYQQPQVYDATNLKSTAATADLFALTKPINVNAKGGTSTIRCNTLNNKQEFRVIAKNRDWGKDFWNDLVGPELGIDMDVETWIRGKNVIPPVLDSDGIHKTFDIKYIDLSRLGAPWAWPETRDHAKWGITTSDDWVCVGDMNRMISQEKRGGGTIALQDRTLWEALSQTDLLVVPPGHTLEEARQLIQATHRTPEGQPGQVSKKVPLKKSVTPKKKTK